MYFQKPVSSVAPTSVQVTGGKPSPIYQTSSTKIQPVQPQTVSQSLLNNQNQYPKNNQNTNGYQSTSSQSLLMSPPQSSSTPMSTPDVSDKNVPKPALPPKPSKVSNPFLISGPIQLCYDLLLILEYKIKFKHEKY